MLELLSVTGLLCGTDGIYGDTLLDEAASTSGSGVRLPDVMRLELEPRPLSCMKVCTTDAGRYKVTLYSAYSKARQRVPYSMPSDIHE